MENGLKLILLESGKMTVRGSIEKIARGETGNLSTAEFQAPGRISIDDAMDIVNYLRSGFSSKMESVEMSQIKSCGCGRVGVCACCNEIIILSGKSVCVNISFSAELFSAGDPEEIKLLWGGKIKISVREWK